MDSVLVNCFVAVFRSSLVMVLFCGGLVFGQDGPPESNINYNSAAEVNSKIKLPKSPEADAFEKYGNTPVNLYTGTPDISIPLHTIKGREFDVPLTLTYDASGIKVSQIATNVGLGWNLNLGGRISRIANGTPDDIGSTSPYEHNYEILNYLDNGLYNEDIEIYLNEFMMPVVNGVIDTQLDFYSLNAIGINDYIVRDLRTSQYHTLMNPRITVEYPILGGWKVVGEDGIEYYFNNANETTTIQSLSDGGGPGVFINGVSTTSWLLKKIISKNKLDIYDFDYKLYSWNDYLPYPINSLSFKETLLCPIELEGNYGVDNSKNYKISQQTPFKIFKNTELMVEIKYKTRSDLTFINPYQGGNAIDEILFYNFKTPLDNPTSFKKIIFNHSYFGQADSPNYRLKRLKLDSLTFYKTNISKGKTYSFEYDRAALIPSINSFGQDYLGLNNGSNLNTTLVPKFLYHFLSGIEEWTPGGDRNFDFSYMTIGTLNRIIYPTKGYTTFEYEQNTIPKNTDIPEHIDNEQIEVLNYIHHNNGNCTGDIPDNYILPHTNMTFLPFPSTSGSGIQLNHTSYSKTTLLTIDETRVHRIESSGIGYYMIQKVSGCENPSSIQYPQCNEHDNNTYEPIENDYYPCLIPTTEQYVNSSGTNHSCSAQDFISGGITYPNNVDQYILLQAGTYQVTLWGTRYEGDETNPDDYPEVGVLIFKIVPTHVPASTYYDTKKIEGFRIKSIKDFNYHDLASTKEYKYITDLNTNNCSAVQLGVVPSIKRYNTKYLACIETITGVELGICKIIPTVVVNSSNINSTPNVAYSSVFEISKVNSFNIGYTQSKFNVGSNGIIYNDDGLTFFEPVFKNGKLAEKNNFNSAKIIKSSEIYTYSDDIEFYRESSFSYVKNIENNYAYSENGMDLNFAESICTNINGGAVPMPGAIGPPENLNSYIWSSPVLGKYCYHPVNQHIYGKYGYLSKKETSTFTPSDEEIKQTEEFTYDVEPPFRLQNKTITTSDGDTTTEEYTYHDDYPTNPEKITDIITSSGNAVTHRKNLFEDIGSDANMLTQINTAKGANALEPRLKFNYSTTTKNIISTLRNMTPNAPNTDYDSYVFGYDEQFPVAKLQGVKYSDIPQNLLDEIRGKSKEIINEANTNALITALNNLRAAFPNAMITTYTYDPVIGMTSQTDSKGYTTYYEYDELNRLLRIKDADGNILKENQYNYRPNQN